MATQLFAQTEAQLDTYLPAYKNILSAVGFVNINTGETIKLSAEQKIIWLYMLDRYKFFKEKDQQYFDNQSDIASAAAVSERTVLRFIKSLSDYGYLQINQTRIGGHKSNSYTLLSDLVLVQPEKAPKKPVQAKTERTNAIAAPAQQIAVEELIEPYSDTHESDSHIPASESFATESIPFDDEPDWVVATLQDDGSTYDAMTFKEEQIPSVLPVKNSVELKDIPKPAPKKENKFDAVISKEMPEKRFNHNGQPSYEMRQWCESQGISLRVSKGDWIFKVNGKDCSVSADGFIPYVAAAAMTANQTDPWAHIPEPF